MAPSDIIKLIWAGLGAASTLWRRKKPKRTDDLKKQLKKWREVRRKK